jgi:hypothetical protein
VNKVEKKYCKISLLRLKKKLHLFSLHSGKILKRGKAKTVRNEILRNS